jgi:glycosyltransferase involved in cell wall biosynthesis
MRVAFITHYTELYGANRSLLNLIDGLVTLGVQPFIVVPDAGDITLYLQNRGIPFFITPHQPWTSIFESDKEFRKIAGYLRWWRGVFNRLIMNLCIIPRVVRKFKEWNIDIVYSNSSLIPLGAIAALWMRKPHIWHFREFGDLDYNLTHDWGKTITNFILSKSDAYICVSEAIRSHYSNRLNNNKCHVLYNGIATKTEMDKLRAESFLQKENSDKFVFSLVGLIHPNKGQDIAIRALALLKDLSSNVHLIIAGGGNTKDLENLAEACGVSGQVTFLGYAENPYDVYLQSDAVLMCSKNEAMGRVTVEAMATVKPVIGYNGGGTAELISHEINGLLYEGEEKGLSLCMRRIVENPDWAREMGENGWRIAMNKYSIEEYAGRIYVILSALHDQGIRENSIGYYL